MKRTSLWWAALAALVLLPSGAVAHEGHAPESSLWGVLHQLGSPYHLVSVVAVLAIVGAVLVGVALRRRAPRRPVALPEER